MGLLLHGLEILKHRIFMTCLDQLELLKDIIHHWIGSVT